MINHYKGIVWEHLGPILQKMLNDTSHGLAYHSKSCKHGKGRSQDLQKFAHLKIGKYHGILWIILDSPDLLFFEIYILGNISWSGFCMIQRFCGFILGSVPYQTLETSQDHVLWQKPINPGLLDWPTWCDFNEVITLHRVLSEIQSVLL